MEEKLNPKNRLHQNQLDQLNNKLQNYKKLLPEIQGKVRRDVIQQVNAQRDQFKKKLEEAKAELKMLNLILGATGAGKSTLFNYLNDLPLIIKEGVGNNGVKNQTIRLDVDRSKVSSDVKIAPIGHGFISETTIPNFAKSRNSKVTYVDCAGEFDSRDILQSIINSYFKYQLAIEAQMVKLTIVINYNDIYTNRGTIFKQILKQVGNFIGLWEDFLNSQSISLVITGVDLSVVKDAKNNIISTIKDIAQDVKDLGLFKSILQNIAKRAAVAVFAAPARKYKTIINEDGNQELQSMIPQGQPYKPNSKICSPDIISKTLDQTNFMKSLPGLFLHNLQSNAQYIVNAICEGTIEEIKTEVMNAIVMNAIEKNQSIKQQKKPLTIQQFNSQKSSLKEKINNLSNVKEISEIIKIFNVKNQFLKKYQILCQDLNEFLKISNIPNIEKKIIQVVKDITIFLREKIEIIDKDALNFANKRYQSMQKQISVLKDQQKRIAMERNHELDKIDRMAQHQKEKQDRQRSRERQKAINQRKLQKIKMKNELEIKKIQNQRQKNKMEIQAKKQVKKMEVENQMRNKDREFNALQLKQKYELQQIKINQENSIGGILAKGFMKGVDKVLDKKL